MTGYYTRLGDEGYTQLLGKGRVPKYHPRPEALGALDEASAALGLARAFCSSTHYKTIIVTIQRDLNRLMSEVAATPENAERFQSITPKRVQWIEEQINELTSNIEPLQDFILSGDTPCGAALSLARTSIRRAERRVAGLFHNGEINNLEILRYLNRLSSLCFVMEIIAIKTEGSSSFSFSKGGSE